MSKKELIKELNNLIFTQKELIRSIAIKTGWQLVNIMLIICGCMLSINICTIIGGVLIGIQTMLMLSLIGQYKENKQVISFIKTMTENE